MHDHQPVARIVIGIGQPARDALDDLVIGFAVGRRRQHLVHRIEHRPDLRHDIGVIAPAPAPHADLDQARIGLRLVPVELEMLADHRKRLQRPPGR